MKPRLAFPLICLLAGCASVKNTEVGESWDRTSQCAARRGQAAVGLGGRKAIDCGVLVRGAFGDSGAHTATCVAHAARDGPALRFGEVVQGVDSGECRIIVRDRMGKVAHITYHHDSSLPTPKRWREAELCAGLAGSGSTHATEDFFTLARCVQDDALGERFEALRQDASD